MMGPFGMWGMGSYWGGPWAMVLGFLFWILVLFGIVYFVAYLVRWSSGDVKKEESPMEVLKKRYARGEIDAEEFAKIKKNLES